MDLPDSLHGILPGLRSVCVMTGAGVSAESGVPTFRGNEGLWKKFRAKDLASVEGFLRNPDAVWEWYAYRRQLLKDVRPNAAHEAIAELESLVDDFLLVTQNVDGLHQVAGSRRMVELHGNIRRNRCQACGKDADAMPDFSRGERPLCASCGGWLRPAVVWFGELLPMEAFARAEESARRCQLFVLVGTSGVVYPAASIPFSAKSRGAYILEINPEETELSRYADGIVRSNATAGVPALTELVKQGKVA